MTGEETTPPQARASRTVGILAALVLAGIVLVVFAQVCRFDFVEWDDLDNVFRNPYLHPVNLPHLARFWREGYFELYTPLMYMAWSLCALISPPSAPSPGLPNPSASVFHGLNLLLHLGNTLLVYRLLCLLLRRIARGRAEDTAGPETQRRNVVAAAGGTALFALHPLQVEVISWVTGANNLLAAFFSLIALNIYLAEERAADTGSAQRPRVNTGFAGKALAASVFFIAALLSKPTASATAGLALLLDWGTRSRHAAATFPRRRLIVPGIWLLLVLADAVVTRFSSSNTQAIVLPLWGRPIIAGAALWFYLVKLFVPVDMAMDYTRAPDVVLHSAASYIETVAVVILASLIRRFAPRPVQVGALVFAIALAPALGFVPFYLHYWSTVGDRYAYLALLGPAFVVAYLWRFAVVSARLQRLLLALYAIAVAFWGVQSYVQTSVWENSRSLFEHTLLVSPHSNLAMFKLGGAREREGDPDGAIAAFESVIENTGKPGFSGAYFALGSVLARVGRVDEGIPLLRQAITIYPNYADAHRNLGLALEQKGQWEDAARQFEAALRAYPAYEAVVSDLEFARLQASAHAGPLVVPPPESDPTASAKNAEGISRARSGDLAGAVLSFHQAIRARPDYTEAFFNLGVTLDKQGAAADAESAYHSALLRQPTYPEAHFNLGLDLARGGDLTAALAEIREAVREKPDWELPAKTIATLSKAAPQ